MYKLKAECMTNEILFVWHKYSEYLYFKKQQ